MARILVIDDNADVRAVVAGVLEAAGHEVVAVADGVLGMDAQRKSPALIVVTDILMPEKDGIETIRDLKQEFPRVGIIAMSGSGKHLKNTEPSLLVASELGADAVLRKPFAPDVLLGCVERMLKEQAA